MLLLVSEPAFAAISTQKVMAVGKLRTRIQLRIVAFVYIFAVKAVARRSMSTSALVTTRSVFTMRQLAASAFVQGLPTFVHLSASARDVSVATCTDTFIAAVGVNAGRQSRVTAVCCACALVVIVAEHAVASETDFTATLVGTVTVDAVGVFIAKSCVLVFLVTLVDVDTARAGRHIATLTLRWRGWDFGGFGFLADSSVALDVSVSGFAGAAKTSTGINAVGILRAAQRVQPQVTLVDVVARAGCEIRPEAEFALTPVGTDRVEALGVSWAARRISTLAFVDVPARKAVSAEAGLTLAVVTARQIVAVRVDVALAEVVGAFVHIRSAVGALIAGSTVTSVSKHSADTRGTVLARIRQTRIRIADLAVASAEMAATNTLIRVPCIVVYAPSEVVTANSVAEVAFAFVFAVDSFVAWRARAAKAKVRSRLAGPTVETRRRVARVKPILADGDVFLGLRSGEPLFSFVRIHVILDRGAEIDRFVECNRWIEVLKHDRFIQRLPKPHLFFVAPVDIKPDRLVRYQSSCILQELIKQL